MHIKTQYFKNQTVITANYHKIGRGKDQDKEQMKEERQWKKEIRKNVGV